MREKLCGDHSLDADWWSQVCGKMAALDALRKGLLRRGRQVYFIHVYIDTTHIHAHTYDVQIFICILTYVYICT